MLIRGPRHARTRGFGHPGTGSEVRGDADGPEPAEVTGRAGQLPDLLDALLDAVSVGIVVQRPDGSPLCVNAAARALLGPEPASALAAAVASALRRGRLQQTVLGIGPEHDAGGAHRGDDGEPSEVLVTTVPIAPYGKPVAALVSTVSAEPQTTDAVGAGVPGQRPVTVERGIDAEAAKLQRALVRAEQHMLAITEHAPSGLAAVALDGRILHVNPALARMLGRSPGDLVGSTLGDLDAPDGAPEVPLLRRLAAGESERFDVERRYQRPGGESVHAAVSLVAVPDEGGRPGHALLQVTDLTETRLALEMLQHQALHDPLTGLPNRTLALDRIGKALERAQRTGARVAVLCIDLDRFKVLNDSVGPDLGDVVLVEVADRLQLALRAGDTAARLAGDEFALVCDGVRDENEAVVIAERVLTALREPVLVDGRRVVPTASVGIALSREDESAGSRGASALLRDAGAALHRAKEDGQGGWDLVDDELRRKAVDRMDIEESLRAALVRDELRLHLQPIVDLTTGAVVGREALLRWQHPERGLLPPAWFLPVAEESGLIDDLGRWVLDEAARIAAATPELGYMAVNVSPSQVRRASLLGDVEDSLKSSGLHPSMLVIELTESVMLGSAAAGRRQLHQLERIGVRMMVDDFGTGFSALSHLRDLPVSGIKVDRTFTAGLGRDRQCDRIVEALTGLARGLGVDIVAEGVETTQQRDVLAGFGCAHAQGYLFGRPAPVSV
jgi:diguanylate cyclase (GGDEF)-like protein/PAS domain S-box-containing protein